MKQHSRRSRWLARFLEVLITSTLMAILLSFMMDPPTHVDRPPEEANRVIHPSGFSMVQPVGAKTHVETEQFGPSVNAIYIRSGGRSRYNTLVAATRLSNPPDLERFRRDGFQRATFQGEVAWVGIGDAGKYVKWATVFQRGDQWYEVSLSEPAVYGRPAAMPPPVWVPYLNSFKVEQATVATAATTRATLVPPHRTRQ